MDHLLLAAETLQKAETELRDLVAKAAACGDYAKVVQIASWAQAVNDITGHKAAARDKQADFAYTNGHSTAVAQVKTPARSSRKESKDKYPQFFRRGDTLVRVAWSKRDKSEYQHKTSEAVLKKLADTLCTVGKDGRVFSTDDLLPIRDDDGSTVPTYQAYVCIALLKQTGLLDQHGRQGYSIPRRDDFKQAIESIWTTLPDKSPRRPR